MVAWQLTGYRSMTAVLYLKHCGSDPLDEGPTAGELLTKWRVRPSTSLTFRPGQETLYLCPPWSPSVSEEHGREQVQVALWLGVVRVLG